MVIKKDMIALALNREQIPFDRRVCLVTGIPSDGWVGMVDWEGDEHELPESELTVLAQSQGGAVTVQEALASCYEEVVRTLAAICDVIGSEV